MPTLEEQDAHTAELARLAAGFQKPQAAPTERAFHPAQVAQLEQAFAARNQPAQQSLVDRSRAFAYVPPVIGANEHLPLAFQASPKVTDSTPEEVSQAAAQREAAAQAAAMQAQQDREPSFSAPQSYVVPQTWDRGRYPLQDATVERREQFLTREEKLADAQAKAEFAAMSAQQKAFDRRAEEDGRVANEIRFQGAIEDSERQTKLNEIKAATEAEQSYKVDPGRYFKNQNTGTKISMILGGALGGLFGSLSGDRENKFLKKLDRAVEQDIRLQENELDMLKRQKSNTLNQLGLFEQQTGSRQAARLAQHNLILSGIQRDLEAQMLEPQRQNVLVKLQAMHDQVEGKRLQNQMERDQITHIPKHVVTVGGGGAAKGITASSNLYVPALKGIARSEDEAKTLRDVTTTSSEVVAGLRELATLREEIGPSGALKGKVYQDEKYRKMKLLQEHLRPKVGFLGKRGVLSDSESAQVEAEMGNVTDVTGSPHETARYGANLIERGTANLVKGMGVIPVREGFARDSKGNIVNAAEFTGERPQAPTEARKVKREAIK